MRPSGGASTAESFMPSCKSALRPASMYTEPSLTYFTRNTVGLLVVCGAGLPGAGTGPSGAWAGVGKGEQVDREQTNRASATARAKEPGPAKMVQLDTYSHSPQ